MGLLARYLLNVAIALAVSEDNVRASLLLQALQDCLKGTDRGIAGTRLRPPAGPSQPGSPSAHRLPAGISQVHLVQHQDMWADAQCFLQHRVPARQRDVSTAKDNNSLPVRERGRGEARGAYGAAVGHGLGEGAAWRETGQPGGG